MNLTYYPTIPNPPDDPADDVGDMQTNSGSINTWTGIDHFGFNNSNGGYHSTVHQPTGSGTVNMTRSGASASYTNNPLSISGVNQVLTGTYTPNATATSADTQLFTISGSGVISQLTGYLTGLSNGRDGWQWLGGILIQWGFVSFGSSSGHLNGTVTLKDRVTGAIPFPNYLFSINATLSCSTTSSATNSNTLAIFSISKTSFTWNFNSSSGSGSSTYPGFYWIAIGN